MKQDMISYRSCMNIGMLFSSMLLAALMMIWYLHEKVNSVISHHAGWSLMLSYYSKMTGYNFEKNCPEGNKALYVGMFLQRV